MSQKISKTAREEEGKKDLTSCPRMLDVTRYVTLVKPENLQHLAKNKKWVRTLWSLGHSLKNMRLDGFGGVSSKVENLNFLHFFPWLFLFPPKFFFFQ